MSEWLRTGIGTSTAEAITIRGRDLAGDLMGKVSFTELAFLLAAGRIPNAGEARLFDAVLVSLADHGLTPTVLAARLTYTGAPEAIQGAVAAGLLGAGTVFLGVVEDTARFLGRILDGITAEAGTERVTAPAVDRSGDHFRDEILDAAAEQAVRETLAAGRRIPGLGHPVHKVEDPRTPRLYAIAEEAGFLGPHLRLLRHVAVAHRAVSGNVLPVNGAGVGGAALADLGFPASLVRGFALLARTAGIVGHLAEEMTQPIGMALYREVDHRAVYTAEPPPA
jgi:citrate synthase